MNPKEIFLDDNLPPRLSKGETLRLIIEASNGSIDARNQIIMHNMRLVISRVMHRFSSVDYDKKDLVSIGTLGLIDAVDNFDLSKGVDFSTFAVTCIDNKIFLFLKKLNKEQNVDSFDKVVFQSNNGKDITLEDTLEDSADSITSYEQEEKYKVIREVVEKLSERDKKMIKMYFGFDEYCVHTQEEIAEEFGVSRAWVSFVILRALKQVKRQLENKGIIDVQSGGGRKRKL